MRKYYWRVVLCAGLLAACGLAGSDIPLTVVATREIMASPTSVTPSEGKIGAIGDEAVIVFKRGGGLAGVSEEWRIYPDGQVVSMGAPPRKAPAEEVALLISEIKALGFFEMNDVYGRFSRCADCFHYDLTVTSAGKTKTVSTMDAASDAPPELQKVLEKVTTLLASLPPK